MPRSLFMAGCGAFLKSEHILMDHHENNKSYLCAHDHHDSAAGGGSVPFVIEQEHCLHCGNCFRDCPVSAIEKLGG